MGEFNFYAELEVSDYESGDYKRFIGIFSTTEKAQRACQEDNREQGTLGQDTSLRWEAFGDSVKAESVDRDTYHIWPLEIDRRIKGD